MREKISIIKETFYQFRVKRESISTVIVDVMTV